MRHAHNFYLCNVVYKYYTRAMKYRNQTSNDLDLTGIGHIVAGGEFETDVHIENPNFVVIGQEVATPLPEPVSAPEPEATPLPEQSNQ